MIELGFVLKKCITFFIEPFGLVFSLLFIGIYFLFIKKESFAKIFLSFSLGLMFLFSYKPVSNYLVKNLEKSYEKYDYKTEVKYIHVLGYGHNSDSTQPLSSQLTCTSIKRDLEGILIYKQMKNAKIIFTGYSGKSKISAAKMNEKLALALGVESENIIISSKPKDTKEEAEFTKNIVGDKPFALVTSATHMRRSILLFKSLGMNPIAAPTNFYRQEVDSLFCVPSMTAFRLSQVAIHEYIGLLWTKIMMLY